MFSFFKESGVVIFDLIDDEINWVLKDGKSDKMVDICNLKNIENVVWEEGFIVGVYEYLRNVDDICLWLEE